MKKKNKKGGAGPVSKKLKSTADTNNNSTVSEKDSSPVRGGKPMYSVEGGNPVDPADDDNDGPGKTGDSSDDGGNPVQT